ncbi:ParB-like protein [Methylocystis sp. IM3]|uniref:ParB-like protein n=1 Tax=unclassified Methylocystis TaxID=2625913 RepID=UPI0030F6E152
MHELIKVMLAELRPTQCAVGYEEVELKRQSWSSRTTEQKSDYIASRPFPAVLGPCKRYFIIDGHHLGLALLKEGVDWVWVRPVADFSRLGEDDFWKHMAQKGFLCPSPANAEEQRAVPEHLEALGDDPYRSLVGRLRRTCGCPKDGSPFAEFRWADLLRRYISPESLRAHPDATLASARELVRRTFCPHLSAQCRCADCA